MSYFVSQDVSVRRWLELGARGIDTAWDYKNAPQIASALGYAQDALGVKRDDVFITSKVPGAVGKGSH